MDSRRLQSRAFKLFSHIASPFPVAFASCVAAFQFVIRKKFHMAPPSRAILPVGQKSEEK